MRSTTAIDMNQTTSRLRRTGKALAAPVGCAMVVASCGDVLNTSPMGSLTDVTFYETHEHFVSASLAAYSTLLNYAWNQDGSGLFMGTYMPDDDIRYGGWPGGATEAEFRWTAGNNNFRQLWTESYKGIMRTNMILDNLPRASAVSEANKRRFEGEARFLRGYFYFFLARHFADPERPSIPLILSTARTLGEAYPEAVPTAAVWDQIEADLEFAASALPEKERWATLNPPDGGLGRATASAANALLGKVRIYRAQWFNNPDKYRQAIGPLRAVQGQLMENYQHNFLESTQNNAESIFEVQMSEGTDFNGWDPVDSGYGSASYSRDIVWGPNCYEGQCIPDTGRSYGALHLTLTAQAFFNAQAVTVNGESVEDPRRRHTFPKHGERFFLEDWAPLYNSGWSITGATPAKYVAPMMLNTWAIGRAQVNDYNNDRLIRYADVLLLLAEAELLGNNDVAEAARLVNEVRARAWSMAGVDIHARGLAVPSSGDRQQWHRQYLQRERRLEFMVEGHRYDDLVRWHRAGLINIAADVDFGIAQANQNWQPRHLLKPIPQQELDRNANLSQHPGY
jgi:starch-binding outer membrane protein, SusD/RagB family